MTAIAKIEPQQMQHRSAVGELTVQDLVDRKRKILDVMNAVMIEGEHYGKIPGCGDKPALFKSGAEVLATTFGLAPRFKVTKTDLGNGHREIEVTCELVTIGNGTLVGEGLGSCSTMESKYRWRQGQRTCPSCGSTAILKSKDKPEWFCWRKKNGCGATFGVNDPAIAGQSIDRVENPDIADQYNTVLKMAKKRAQVDATLTATGASDLLTQDIEDLPPASADYDRPRNDNRRDAVDAEVVEPVEDANVGNQSELEVEALTLKELLEATQCEADVRKLTDRCARLPKDSRERAFVREVYQQRLDFHRGQP